MELVCNKNFEKIVRIFFIGWKFLIKSIQYICPYSILQ